MSDNFDEPSFNFNEKSVIIYKLGRIESMLTEVNSRLGAQSIDQARNDTRLNKLETRWAWASGIAASVSFIVTVLANFFYRKLGT